MPSLKTRIVPEEEQTLQTLLECSPEEEREVIVRAYEMADRFHQGQTRSSGDPYIKHPLAVAHMLADLNLDSHTIAAGLLHDVVEDTALTSERLKEEFPSPIPEIVGGVTKISKIGLLSSDERQVENFRRMILAMAKDIRVVIVKLCDRLHNMRTLKFLPEDRREAIAHETMDIYAPLANRLGMTRIKTEMEDEAMRWLYPKDYAEVRAAVAKKRTERDRLVAESLQFLQRYLERHGFSDVQVSGRSKHFYSIFKKMRDQGLTFDQIYDLNALRIICPTVPRCYEILGLIHSIWPPVPGRIKDYIGTPKKNMYQSLHTSVIGLGGEVTEIQIRTIDMHQVAELGIAAHWKYKEKEKGQLTADERLDWLRQLTEWVTEVRDKSTLLDALRRDVFADLVLCFTPTGDIVELPAGATPIDFAYAIHTQVGERCVGARVNKRMVALRHRLQNGDVVEIQTSPTGHPSRDWLEAVVTGRARAKIKHWLKSKEMGTWVEAGRNALVRLLDERSLDVSMPELETAMKTVLKPYKLHTTDDLLAEIGFGSISAAAALARMNPEWGKPRARAPRGRAGTRKEAPIIVEGLLDVQTKLANCCNPIPGDPIVGFITRGRGVTVHHGLCRNVGRLRAAEGDRVVRARWNANGPIVHTVSIQVEADDRTGLLTDMSALIARHNIFINACRTKSDKKRRSAILRFELDVPDARALEAVQKDLRTCKGVLKVERTNRPW